MSAAEYESNPNDASVATEVLPRRFGSYLLFDRIGRGGMANIYLASMSTAFGGTRRVVVKQMLPHLGRDPQFSKMLIEEAKLCAGLRHANVVQVLDLGREGELLYIGMEYVEGFDLNHLLRSLSKRRIAFPAQFVLFVVVEMLTALDYAHRRRDPDGLPLGIVHRDVSPSNVLVSFEGEVKLCDFGIAKAFRNAVVSDEEMGGIAGKAAYMSPEQANGEPVDARSDVFAAGIVLWELCAGRRLYRGSEQQMLEMARESKVPSLPERGMPDHATLQSILDRALARDKEARFSTGAEFLTALDTYMADNGLFASQLRFANFLSEHFQEEVVLSRRQREIAAQAIDRGPLVELVPHLTKRPQTTAEALAELAESLENEPDEVLDAYLPLHETSDAQISDPYAMPEHQKEYPWPFLVSVVVLVVGAAIAFFLSL